MEIDLEIISMVILPFPQILKEQLSFNGEHTCNDVCAQSTLVRSTTLRSEPAWEECDEVS